MGKKREMFTYPTRQLTLNHTKLGYNLLIEDVLMGFYIKRWTVAIGYLTMIKSVRASFSSRLPMNVLSYNRNLLRCFLVHMVSCIMSFAHK